MEIGANKVIREEKTSENRKKIPSSHYQAVFHVCRLPVRSPTRLSISLLSIHCAAFQSCSQLSLKEIWFYLVDIFSGVDRKKVEFLSERLEPSKTFVARDEGSMVKKFGKNKFV